jgi:hypothetical protein
MLFDTDGYLSDEDGFPVVPPPLYAPPISEEDVMKIQILSTALHSLRDSAHQFRADVNLFLFAKPYAVREKITPPELRGVEKWPYIAAHDGAINLFNFDKALKAL